MTRAFTDDNLDTFERGVRKAQWLCYADGIF